MLERLATVRIAKAYYDPAYHKEPTFIKGDFDRDKLKIKLDDDAGAFAAMCLDPASFRLVRDRSPGQWQEDLVAHLYQVVLAPRTTVAPRDGAGEEAAAGNGDGAAPAVGPGGGGGGGGGGAGAGQVAVPTTRQELKKHIAAIRQRPKPKQQDQELYDEDTDALVDEAERKFAHLKGGGGDDPDEVQGGGGIHDPMLPMLEALRVEVRVLAEKHAQARKDSQQGKHPYGKTTLTEGPVARYEFWPSMAKQTPLLYFCAQAILAASSNSTTFNERMHSPAGRIFSDLRASLTPASVEHLTLALFYARKWVKEKMATAQGALEREELELHFEAVKLAGEGEGKDGDEEDEEIIRVD